MSKNLSLREQQKAEAIKRMRMLSLHPNVINEFITDNTLHKSEDYGVVYWLDDKEKQIVKEFEKSTMLSFITSLKVIPNLVFFLICFMYHSILKNGNMT